VEYLDVGNITGASIRALRGYDSEQLVATQVLELRDQGHQVHLEQLYSSASPASPAPEFQTTTFRGRLFSTVPEMRGRGKAIMEAYGLTPP
jgi:hypothetical protein